jgi:hypothetical protein
MNFYADKLPFNDNYLIVAGMDEVIGLIQTFKSDESYFFIPKYKKPSSKFWFFELS